MSIANKKILILRATSDACDVEIGQIERIAKMHSIEPTVAEVKCLATLQAAICAGVAYDYLYVAAHGDGEGFAGDNFEVSWWNFAIELCKSPVLNQNCILLLACCRGGLKYVAYDMFAGCDRIEYVFGPRWTVTSPDIITGFHVFIYNMEDRRLQPDQAAERASDATGYDFLCFDRVEVEQSHEYLNRVPGITQTISPITGKLTIDPDQHHAPPAANG